MMIVSNLCFLDFVFQVVSKSSWGLHRANVAWARGTLGLLGPGWLELQPQLPSRRSLQGKQPSKMSDNWQPQYEATVKFIKSKLPADLQTVEIGVICGSGLGGLEATADPGVKVKIDYKVRLVPNPRSAATMSVLTSFPKERSPQNPSFAYQREHRAVCLLG